MMLSRSIRIVAFAGTIAVVGVAAQPRQSHLCTVDSADLATKETLNLSTFNTAIGKNLSTMESYFLRGTDKQYLIARVFYPDELMETDQSTGRGPESVSLELWIVNSPNATLARETPPTKSLAFAEAEQPLKGFDIGRVMLMAQVGSTQKSFMMKCMRAKPSRLP